MEPARPRHHPKRGQGSRGPGQKDFLAGPRAAFCTGGEYKVDGGLLAKIGVVLPD